MFDCDCPPYDCAGRVGLYLAGNREAGDELARKFEPLVRRIVQRILGPEHREEWEDACQAIFLRLFANLAKWEQRCPFCKWLAVVAARRAIDLARAAQSFDRLPTAGLADSRQTIGDSDLKETIVKALAGFPPPWRQAWHLWAQGASREEMARGVGKSVRTVQYWLAEMLDEVREKLAE
jgi:RNA polymerase sigma factor (sigma-70 family)